MASDVLCSLPRRALGPGPATLSLSVSLYLEPLLFVWQALNMCRMSGVGRPLADRERLLHVVVVGGGPTGRWVRE